MWTETMGRLELNMPFLILYTASEEHFYRLSIGDGLRGWLHSLPIDNDDDLRAALLIHRFPVCESTVC